MNQAIEEEVARKVAKLKGFLIWKFVIEAPKHGTVQKKKEVVDENDEKFLEPRPPVVAF